MKTNLPLALLGAAALVALRAEADDSIQSGGSSTDGQPALAVVTTSRGTPLGEQSHSAAAPAPAPAARPAAPTPSRADSGTILRSTVSSVLQDTSHIVVTSDTEPAHYRYTKGTRFIDEGGRVLSADAVKSGTNVTLHFTRTEGDLVLTTVIVNGTSRPLVGTDTQALTEVQYDR
jgi:hypothetical protein